MIESASGADHDPKSPTGRAQLAEENRRLGSHIREARERAGVSLRSLAKKIGISPTTMSQLEIGRTNVSVVRLNAIATVLGLAPQDLFNGQRGGRGPSRSRAVLSKPKRFGEHLDRAAAVIGEPPADWREFSPLNLDGPLRAGIALFSSVGYHGSTIRDLAQYAQMSIPGLYHHYTSKQELLALIVAVASRETRQRVEAAAKEGTTPRERLTLVTEALTLYNTCRNDIANVAVTEHRHVDGDERDKITADRVAIQRCFEQLVEQGVAAGEFATSNPRESARSVVMLCTAIISWFQPGGPMTPPGLATLHADFALRLVQATDR